MRCYYIIDPVVFSLLTATQKLNTPHPYFPKYCIETIVLCQLLHLKQKFYAQLRKQKYSNVFHQYNLTNEKESLTT